MPSVAFLRIDIPTFNQVMKHERFRQPPPPYQHTIIPRMYDYSGRSFAQELRLSTLVVSSIPCYTKESSTTHELRCWNC